jgi:ABC-type sulfate transport system permease component
MNPGAGNIFVEIVVGVVIAMVLLALPVVIRRKAVLAPYRAARRLLERLAGEVGGLSVA